MAVVVKIADNIFFPAKNFSFKLMELTFCLKSFMLFLCYIYDL